MSPDFQGSDRRVKKAGEAVDRAGEGMYKNKMSSGPLCSPIF